MAWQLIYTSAPRLLEAGRTGFGTVARHRAVSGMLASSVERFSQFARLPGHDPRRIVHACRILTVGSGTYHVLSCLQDAGSDYTGRTNHIAHHLIAEPREIRALSAAGLTPADVLLAMAWRTSWSEGPRYLDPAEEIDLSSFTASTSKAWATVNGNPATASILWSREALKGCYLITPSGISCLDLFRESLLLEPGQAWQTRFTTCLEPNEDVAEFRWVGLPSSSPLRVQVETSNRLVLDLTRPDTLPAPPVLDVPAQAPVPAPAPKTVRPSEPEPAHTTPAAVREKPRSSGTAPAPVSSMSGWSPEPRQMAPQSNKNFIAISLVIAGALILTVVGALLRQDFLQKQAHAAYEGEIAKTWEAHQLILGDTRKLLEKQPNLEEGNALLKSHEVFFSSMQKLLHKPGTPAQLPLPDENEDDLRDLKKLLEEWAKLHVRPWAKLQSARDTVTALSIHAAYRKWQDTRTAKWKQLSQFISLKDTPPPEVEALQSLKTEAKEVLRLTEPARETLSSWEQLFELLDHQKNSMDPEVRQWLKLWVDLDDANDSAYAAAQSASANNSLPEWLRAKAEALKQKKEMGSMMATKNNQAGNQKAKEVQKQQAAIEDADAISAVNPIYICLLQPNEDPAGKITGLQVSADMQLYVGTCGDRHPPPADALKRWAAASTDDKSNLKFGPNIMATLAKMVQFSNDGTLTAIPEEYRKTSIGLRIVALSKDAARVLFDLRLLPVSRVASSPIFTQVIKTTVNNADTVTISLPAGFLSRLNLVGQKDLIYALRRDGTATEQRFYALKAAGDSSFEVLHPQTKMTPAPILQEIRRQISELEAGILKDDNDLAANEISKISAIQKATRREFYAKGRSDKEIKLQEVRAKLQSLEGPVPLTFVLLPGVYTLLLEQPNKLELCRLNVVPSASPSQSKPSNP